ncbi:MAG: hypothetical protein ACE5IP_09300 [Terriglobia bacterium]
MTREPRPGLPPPGIDAEAWSFVVQRCRLNTKVELHQLGEALSGLNGRDLIDACTQWLRLSGLRTLKLGHVMTIARWVRGYPVQDIFEGLKRAFETADRLGHTVCGPGYADQHIHQSANSPTRREARAGRGPR